MQTTRLFILLFSTLVTTNMAVARTIEIDVYGMTCAFCVDSLERKFSEMDSITSVEVSLKLKKVRLETQAAQPSLKKIEQSIVDAGFTPTKITIL